MLPITVATELATAEHQQDRSVTAQITPHQPRGVLFRLVCCVLASSMVGKDMLFLPLIPF